MALNFSDQVVVVTGAGAGLGRAYALLFGERGAKVVVNDLGGARNGEGSSNSAANSVVEEIKRKGGIAVADYNSVIEGEKIIETALQHFGRIDILVNNAGILRDKSFARISDADWDMVHNVHLKGAFKTTQAAWPHFRKQNYGRIILTSSNSGLYGNFGQANYSSAKMGLIGLCKTLAIEGVKHNIHCNVIVPTAGSRLTEDILPPDFFAELKPQLIAPVVCWLCHKLCEDNGSIIETAAGWATKYELARGTGSLLRKSITETVTIENVQENWKKVTDVKENIEFLSSIEEASGMLINYLEKLKTDNSPNTKETEEPEFILDEKFCILYALGIGATVKDEEDMKYLYEGHVNFCAFPTLGILPGLSAVFSSGKINDAIPGQAINLGQILHGEQYLKLIKPLPTSGILTSKLNIVDVLDKGKNAVIVIDIETYDNNGNLMAYTQLSSFVVGGGGFGGKRKSEYIIEPENPPNRLPDSVIIQKTSENQAALYRLSGDVNPLHIDPSFASINGYSQPILHGLCTLGFSARHVLIKFANNDPSLFKAIKVRFTKPAFPGETIKTEMWQEGNRIYFQTSTVERDNVIISGAYMDLHEVSKINPYLVSNQKLKSDDIFLAIEENLKSDKEIAKKVNGVFLYNLTKDGKHVTSWTLDLKRGKVYKGNPENGVKSDTILTLEDEDMLDLASGKLNPQTAFMKGKLKLKGNLMLAQKLKLIMSPQSKL